MNREDILMSSVATLCGSRDLLPHCLVGRVRSTPRVRIGRDREFVVIELSTSQVYSATSSTAEILRLVAT